MPRILLAEDDESLRGFLARALERAGYEVTACADGEAAVAVLDQDWDLLLTDIVMPGMSGRDLAREIAVDVLTHSAVASPMIQYRGPFVLKQPEEAWFDVNMMQKDMVLAMELGRQLDVPLPTTAISNEFLTAARGMGMEKLDFACMFDVLARMSGISK